MSASGTTLGYAMLLTAEGSLGLRRVRLYAPRSIKAPGGKEAVCKACYRCCYLQHSSIS